MSAEVIVALSTLAAAIGVVLGRSCGEGWRASLAIGALVGFVIPWGVATLFWLVAWGAA